MTTSVHGPAQESVGRPRSRRALLAGAAGNLIEWYEFGVYGYFATVIAATFFTPDGGSSLEGLVATYASFALAFFFRPLGAVLFGRLGDRIGRRPALLLALLLMTGATTLIGLLPDRAAIGAAAPWLLTLLRVLQGLSAGGEFGGAVSVLTEFAPPGRRGLYGAWQSFTVALGLLAGAGTAALTATVLSPAALHAWGWRVPFLLALPLGVVALLLRLRLEETPAFQQARAASAIATGPGDTGPRDTGAAPAAIAPDPRRLAGAVLLGAGRTMGWAAAGYTFLVVLPGYLQSTLHTTFRQALVATVLANLGFAAAILPAGALSDRIGRRAVMTTGAALAVVLAFPLLNLLQDAGSSSLARGTAVILAGAVVGLMAGPGPAMLAEMFPVTVRCTGLGLAYSLANAVFSGCAGLLVTELIKRTGNLDIPAYYVVLTCAVSVAALLTLRGDDHRRPLRDDRTAG
ncbi:MFS transporter [Streptomyces sp. bgisy100]|uniref:MFS transporter n=1 Tax=Streptomyces sp. bgisy100 TaxID=3413783 RepID=UPI003D74C137